ncbi:O-acetylserine/cysteine efflux transporter [Novosphingobium sp. SG751A]|uniref:DMT family transporter n=1 Tax=Novosphingobium sp. SG751A TaxID=2587000 RepID=UPI0015538121|nr:DMT family transporter [Novosphingobium sp. SG751A]NOW48199.1 O-acetylserine/cysteine efflux transporter [Novosphingobium sp. SG751A]
MNQPHQPMGASGLAVALLVNVLFAANVIAMKVVVDATSPLWSIAARMGVVALVCAPWFRIPRGRVHVIAAYGVLNGGLFLLLMNLALHLATNVGALAIVGQLSVPFSLLLGAIVLKERLSPARGAGVALAIIGVLVLGFDPRIAGELPAVLVMAGAAMVWGGAALIQRRLGGIGVMTIQAWNGLMGLVMLAPFAAIFEADKFGCLFAMPAPALGWFAFTSLGSTVLGQGALAWLLQRYPINAVMPLMLAAPVLATCFSALYFHSPITTMMALGGGITLIGVAIIARMK